MRRRPNRFPEDTEEDEPLINLTPLIDVVFVVLIAFMLIAPVLEVDFVDLAQGGTTSKKSMETTKITIVLKADNSIWFQGKKVSLKELENLLKLEKKRHPEQIPHLMPDKKAEFGSYQMIKNTLEICGFEQMDVVLQP